MGRKADGHGWGSLAKRREREEMKRNGEVKSGNIRQNMRGNETEVQNIKVTMSRRYDR